MLGRVALVRTDVSEELSASIIRVTRIGERGTTLAVTSNRRKPRRNTKCVVYPFPEKGEAGASIDSVGSVRVDVKVLKETENGVMVSASLGISSQRVAAAT
jgi:hypothetical protein